MPQFPKPPPPQVDLEPPEAMSAEQYAQYLEELKLDWPNAWRLTDGTLWLERMPAEMAPAVGMVDSPVSLAPDDPLYAKYASTLLREFDYQGKEVPDGTGAVDDADAGRVS